MLVEHYAHTLEGMTTDHWESLPTHLDNVARLLADEVRGHDRVLAIVQRRDDARDLCRLLPPDTFHLSALMCAAHRREGSRSRARTRCVVIS